ncbi:hypothetical protein TPA4_44 [Tsukamurella phage TPA4]|uniref:hypothetical protein n=1 Tax=Tsukamurella phage TPA4 TaxID=1647476 RepID=UPI0007B647D6|nr:hypothetical protein BH784_gp44 [Tsukamurella phage TPA4]AKJ72209.1 hypothetical protein TPA4_44 [Tsukamurella phage TPA4]
MPMSLVTATMHCTAPAGTSWPVVADDRRRVAPETIVITVTLDQEGTAVGHVTILGTNLDTLREEMLHPPVNDALPAFVADLVEQARTVFGTTAESVAA